MDRPALRRRATAVGTVVRASERRERIALALERCDETERLALALLLIERLTPVEAAGVLGMPVTRLTRMVRGLTAELERLARSEDVRPRGATRRRRISGGERLRRAS